MRKSLDRLLALHRIGMDSPLRESFYTTNLIDSAFSNPRSHLNLVKRDPGETKDGLNRALVGALLLAEGKQFRKVRCFRNISKFPDVFLRINLRRKRRREYSVSGFRSKSTYKLGQSAFMCFLKLGCPFESEKNELPYPIPVSWRALA